MKLFTHSRSFRRALIAGGALGLALAGSAQAFTIDNQSGTNADGSAKFADPDSRFSGDGANGAPTTYRNGNMSLQFGARGTHPDRDYNTDQMFQPNGRPAGER
jgi:hypothetical protein